MFTSKNLAQFQPNPNDQEIIDLRNNLASFEKRLGELEISRSESDVGLKIQSVEDDLITLQQQVDNAMKSKQQEAQALSDKFNQLKAFATKYIKDLSEKINEIDNRLQSNVDRGNKTECLGHLDGRRFRAAAAVAERMTTDAVKQLIIEYCGSYEEFNENKIQTISEFINCIQNYDNRQLYRSLLDGIEDEQFATSGTAVSCKGRLCIQCGKCRDWYYNGNSSDLNWIRKYKSWQNSANYEENFQKRRNRATCIARFSNSGGSGSSNSYTPGNFNGKTLKAPVCRISSGITYSRFSHCLCENNCSN